MVKKNKFVLGEWQAMNKKKVGDNVYKVTYDELVKCYDKQPNISLYLYAKNKNQAEKIFKKGVKDESFIHKDSKVTKFNVSKSEHYI